VPLFSDGGLKRLTMPILLYAGEKDVLLHSRKTVERMNRLLPKVKVNLLPGIGHLLLHLDDSILEFLLSHAL
jgi:pimeloyl-ACP methyl ester carboxylesterase